MASLLLLLVTFGFFGVFGFVGIVSGTVVLFASILLYARPKEHAVWGILILVFACVSIVAFGGFVAGMILGIIGGAMAISWRPEGAFGRYGPAGYGAASYGPGGMGPYGLPVMPWRMCMGCGRWIPWSYNVCPLCGTQAPVASWVPRTDTPTGTPPTSAPPPAAPYGNPPSVAQAPAMFAPPRSEPIKASCPTCTSEAEWNPSYNRWYCPAERRYF
jgi:hypothetical protein